MVEAVEFTIGAAVTCEDGECGVVRRVIIDPATRRVTHLAVGPAHRPHAGHLVPVELVDSASAREVRLRCTRAHLDALESDEEVDVEPGRFSYETQRDLVVFSRRGIFGGGVRPEDVDGMALTVPLAPRGVEEDNLPPGEGELWRGQPVHASDGPVGHVRGVVVDPGIRQVTHVLLDEGHMWEKKEVAIPIAAVRDVVDDGVHLSITRAEVGDLPPVDVAAIE